MGFLGNLTARVIRLALAAAILVCAYLFIVEPALQRAGHAIHSGERRLVECVKHANQDVEKIERCTRRF